MVAQIDGSEEEEGLLDTRVEESLQTEPQTPPFPEFENDDLPAPERLDRNLPEIDGYEVLRRIGGGGFSNVYKARQLRPVRRIVAVKILKRGIDTQEVVSRFNAERQVLATLNHPNTAAIYDAGETACGLPYFAMELVGGASIRAYCEAARLSTESRLRLFVTICRAILAAHQIGVIHRDIKPSNVLVTELEGEPFAKVIDFGIAKAMGDGELTEINSPTRDGASPGTPIYMSPEQAAQARDIDARSDIYSLGNLLYEMLAGCHPLESRPGGFGMPDKMKERIRTEDPRRPSAALRSLPAERREQCSRGWGIDAAKAGRELRSDLDAIVMKALEKRRERRYQSADALSSDIVRYLEGRPVEAARQSPVYLFGKFARRNKALLIVVAAIAVLLIAGIVVSTSFAIKADLAKAETALRQAKSIAGSAVATGRRDAGLAALAEATRLRSRSIEIRSIAAELLALEDVTASGSESMETGAGVKRPPVEAEARSEDGLGAVIEIRNTETGEEQSIVRREEFPWIPIPEDGLLQFGPDYTQLACAGPQTSMHLVVADTETGDLTGYVYTKDTLTSFAWHPSGEIIATGHDDAIVRLWRTPAAGPGLLGGAESDLPPTLHLSPPATDAALAILDGHRGEVSALAFHPGGDLLASLDSTGRIRIWTELLKGFSSSSSALRPSLLVEFPLGGGVEPSELRFDEGGNLVFPDGSGRRQAFSAPAFEELFVAADLKEVAWRDDGRRLCAISNNNIYWIEAKPMARFATIERAGPVSVAWLGGRNVWAIPNSIAYVEYREQPTGQSFAPGGERWKPQRAQERSGTRFRVVEDVDDRLAIYFGRRLQISLQGAPPAQETAFDAGAGGLIFDDLHWDRQGRLLTALFVQPGGETLLAKSWTTRSEVLPMGAIPIASRRVVSGQDGQSLIARSDTVGIERIDAASGRSTLLDGSAAAKQDAPLAVSPSGEWIAAASDFGNIRLLRGNGDHYADLRARRPARALSIVWHESEDRFAVVTEDGYLRVWRLEPWFDWIEEHGVAE